jgi:hypothetical protein
MTATVCYFIQSHRDPPQIERLIRVLRRGSPRAKILVRHDFEKCAFDWRSLADLPDTWLMPATGRLVRADYACQVQPYLEAIDWLEREGVEYDWLVNLTAQDYPVQPVARIEAFLGEAQADGFLRSWDVLSEASPWSRRKAVARYWHWYRRLPEGAEPVMRAMRFVTKVLPLHFYLDYGALLGVRALHTPFHDGFRCHGGWAFFSIRRRAALYVRDFLAAHPEVERHYRRTVAAEESLVPTILANSAGFKLVNDDLRYIDYARAQKGSPRTLTCADLPELASGRYHFARKFDLGVDREVLDRIDRELLGLEPEPR